jgi:multicomponent Na+:H+ antiporter subunit E
LRALWRSLIAVPLAYGEAFALIGSGDREEESWIERPAGDPRHRLLIFLEVLAITLTPFTIVLGLSNGERGPHYTIHQLRPRRGKPEEVQP